MSDRNLALAAQCGVTDVVTRYPGPALADLLAVQHRIESIRLRQSVIEGYQPLEAINVGLDDGS
jgi:hypothetical protein